MGLWRNWVVSPSANSVSMYTMIRDENFCKLNYFQLELKRISGLWLQHKMKQRSFPSLNVHFPYLYIFVIQNIIVEFYVNFIHAKALNERGLQKRFIIEFPFDEALWGFCFWWFEFYYKRMWIIWLHLKFCKKWKISLNEFFLKNRMRALKKHWTTFNVLKQSWHYNQSFNFFYSPQSSKNLKPTRKVLLTLSNHVEFHRRHDFESNKMCEKQ